MIPRLTQVSFDALEEVRPADIICIDFSSIAIVQDSATSNWWLVMTPAAEGAPGIKLSLAGHMPHVHDADCGGGS